MKIIISTVLWFSKDWNLFITYYITKLVQNDSAIDDFISCQKLKFVIKSKVLILIKLFNFYLTDITLRCHISPFKENNLIMAYFNYFQSSEKHF